MSPPIKNALQVVLFPAPEIVLDLSMNQMALSVAGNISPLTYPNLNLNTEWWTPKE